MKNKYFIYYLVIGILFMNLSVALAQNRVMPLDQLKNYSGNGGIFYALPRTVIKIKVNLIKTEYYKGPYSAFAEKYLGIDDIIQYDNTRYEISGVDICTFTEADPDQIYFLEVEDEDSKKSQSISVSLDETGVIRSVNADLHKEKEVDFDNTTVHDEEMYSKSSHGEIFNEFLISDYIETYDTVIRVKTIDDTTTIEEEVLIPKMIKKSSEQKAEELVSKLRRTQSDINNLLTGYQEVAYSRESMEFMYNKLKDVESDIIGLFKGVTIKSEENKTIYYTPSASSTEQSEVLFRFSASQGIIDKSSGDGDVFELHLIPSGVSRNIRDSIVKTNTDYGLYYRFPDNVLLKVVLNKETLEQKLIPIEQFGTIVKLPSNKAKVLFHDGSGSIEQFEVR